MKKLLLPLLALALTACGEKKAQTSYADLSGEWVNVSYINAINETKSPIDAQKTTELAEVIISGKNADIIINFHEGASGQLDSLGDGKFVFLIDEIKYDVSLCCDTLTVNADKFVRLANDLTVSQMVNQAILAGNYVCADGAVVELTAEGAITGCNKMVDYNIHIDYYGGEDQVNIVDFSGADGQIMRYTWVVDGDNVNFSNIPYFIPELMDKPSVADNFSIKRAAK